MTNAPPPGNLQLRIAREAASLCRRSLALPVRQWRKRALRSAYRRGCARAPGDLPAEDADPGIVETGRDLRRRLLAASERKHAADGYRVLMLRPRSLTAEIWFGDLEQCMQHAGIDCRVIPHGAPTAAINSALETFQPNVLIATETPGSLGALDLSFIQSFKRRQGCLRLFIPVWHANAPRAKVPAAHSTPEQDEWRRRLRSRGLIADAHFSIYEPEFHERFCRDPRGPAVEHVTIPMACNPFSDYPLPAAKRNDYFMASTPVDERLEISMRLLRPILGRYRGLWAGSRWGFGTEDIAPVEMPLHYAQTRVALSPLPGFVQLYGAELTHRVYATAGCGAFQLTTPTAFTGRYFTPGELAQAATPLQYGRLFDHYVRRPRERNAMALAALRRVYAEHTCFHRIDKLVSHWDDWRRRGLF